MEIELKFLVNDEIARDRILNDSHLAEITQPGSYAEVNMHAVYLDTDGLDLMKDGIVMRVRFENEKTVVTLKWKGYNKGGLHVRGELNVPADRSFADSPDVSVFKGSEMYDAVAAAAGDKKLVPLMETVYVRRRLQIDTGKSISELSLDVGQIVTRKGSEPISELEIELYSGDEEDMLELGRELAAKYNLDEGPDSKFHRGLKLLGLA